MDADQIAEEHARRVAEKKDEARDRAIGGLGRVAAKGLRGARREVPPDFDHWMLDSKTSNVSLTSKDLVGAAPDFAHGGGGAVSWFNDKAKEHQENQMRKHEKWNEIMIKRQMEKNKDQQSS